MLMDAETVLQLSATQAAATNFQIIPAASPPSDTTQDRTLPPCRAGKGRSSFSFINSQNLNTDFTRTFINPFCFETVLTWQTVPQTKRTF